MQKLSERILFIVVVTQASEEGVVLVFVNVLVCFHREPSAMFCVFCQRIID